MTNIEWTDETWNPVTGCSKVSPGCKNCYAEVVADRFWAKQYAPVEVMVGSPEATCRSTWTRARRFTDVRCHPERLEEPLRWRKPRRVFVNSMSDLFHEDVPFEFIDRVWGVMSLAPRHTFQILTKRAERMAALVPKLAGNNRPPDGSRWPLPNVWLGVSVENQHFADERIPLLLQTPAAVRFVSYEPALGPVDFRNMDTAPELHLDALTGVELMSGVPAQGPRLDWVIVGGESGSKARPFDVAWARSVVRQCREAGVACFVKQLGSDPGEHRDINRPDGQRGWFPIGGYRKALYDRKGGDPAEWPEDLRVREYPVCGQSYQQAVKA